MDQERLDDLQDENSSDAVSCSAERKASDISGVSGFHKLFRGITGIFVKLGLSGIKVFAVVLLGIN